MYRMMVYPYQVLPWFWLPTNRYRVFGYRKLRTIFYLDVRLSYQEHPVKQRYREEP